MPLLLLAVVVVTVMFWVLKTLLPEMLKPPVPDNSPADVRILGPLSIQETDKRIEKLEVLLAEKNKNIELLQTELKIFHAQVNNFDKVRSMLEEEIQRLREQNRIFRSELGLPTTTPKENTSRLFI